MCMRVFACLNYIRFFVCTFSGILLFSPSKVWISVFSKGKFCLSRRKIFFRKYFSVFGAIKNNSQIKNIFGMMKKAFLVSENDLYF
jgi:hypothetical protein